MAGYIGSTSGVTGMPIGHIGSTTLGGNLVIPDDGNIGSASDTDAITIDASGNVGIGTSSPDGTLHVHTSSAGAVTPWGNADNLTVESGGATGISVLAPDNQQAQLIFGSPSDNIGSIIRWVHDDNQLQVGTHNSDGFLTFKTAIGSERMRIDSSGHVIVPNGVTLGTSIGTYNAANTLDDYEYGSFQVQFCQFDGTLKYTSPTNSGSYVKVGKLVNITMQIYENSSGSPTFTNGVFIRLPFTSSATPSGSGAAVQSSIFLPSYYSGIGTINSGVIYSTYNQFLSLSSSRDAPLANQVGTTTFSTSIRLYGNFTYLIW